MSFPSQKHLFAPSGLPVTSIEANLLNGNTKKRPRSTTPMAMADTGNATSSLSAGGGDGGEGSAEEDDLRLAAFKRQYVLSECRIGALFAGGGGDAFGDVDREVSVGGGVDIDVEENPRPTKRRKIDEDDYDDFDDDEDNDDNDNATKAPLVSSITPNNLLASPKPPPSLLSRSPSGKPPSLQSGRSSEEVRKKLEQDKQALEDTAKRIYNNIFCTLENDGDAMRAQRKLEESERQVEAELSRANGGLSNTSAGNAQHGTLSTANLGASSLTLKHLLARIDAKRDKVKASDAELRNLISEVRKNRSKWASEEKIGQEELYEAAEKVLSELKAMTEHSSAFLTRVNKREAPDYYNIIKQPMDLGTMTKKLKNFQYKSKQDFVHDLNLIWANCLKYNANPQHFLRKHALYMKKETEKLIPLIPDIVIRDRAEVEAEERRLHAAEAELEGAEESDDEPIMSSRGRKAHGKGVHKGVASSRKAPVSTQSNVDGGLTRPPPQPTPSANGSNHRVDFLRADSEADSISTPSLGTITPLGNGFGSGTISSQADLTDLELSARTDEADLEDYDIEYKTWKQVTKKDRARLAAERNRLFYGDRLNPDEPALLRTRMGMRRWMRKQKDIDCPPDATAAAAAAMAANGTIEEMEPATNGEALVEDIVSDEPGDLPDYYDYLSAIPDLPGFAQWLEDTNGELVDASDEFLRVLPSGYFTSPHSDLVKKLETNMRQMQETRKVCAKIGIVKQMQLQQQMYQNQFQKYDPQPFEELDIPPHVVSDEGTPMQPWVCRAALQRSVSKVFYHAGFEEFQPMALDAITDIAGDFFKKLVNTLCIYRDAPKMKRQNENEKPVHPFTIEEMILHALHENNLDVEGLESYIKDDVERLGSKLVVMHERMKTHLAELLRPALTDAGPDGSNAFNDGSEQFIDGDFAQDLDEDFFGFKELGLDKEFGLASLSVPLHLLQNRMYNAHQAQNSSAAATSSALFAQPPPYEPITRENVGNQVGLVQEFFRAKLEACNGTALIEDDELPQKQRLPKPRLPPTGKISSPRKRPSRDAQGGNAKKKQKKSNAENDDVGGKGGGNFGKPVSKLKLPVLKQESSETPPIEASDALAEHVAKGEVKKEEGVGMISPDSLPIQDIEAH